MSKILGVHVPTAPQNKIINGNMDFWQRATSFSLAATNTYTADRWWVQRGGAVGMTVSQQSISGLVVGADFGIRVQKNAADATAFGWSLGQDVETKNCKDLAGKYVTVSFWVRLGANFSSASLQVRLDYGTGVDQTVKSGFTSQGNAITQLILPSTLGLGGAYQKFTFTSASPLPSTTTQIAAYISAVPVGTAGANDWAEITQVQVIEGTLDRPFTRHAGDMQAELAACQRYFAAANYHCTTDGSNSLRATSGTRFPVTMRTTATVNISSSNGASTLAAANGGASAPLSGFPASANSLDVPAYYISVTASNGSGYGYIGNYTADAEL